MEHEKGDLTVNVGVDDVAEGFRAVGAVPGDTVIYHGSLSSMGKIGSATISGIRTRTLVDETFSLLRQAPQDWFSPPFLAWREECF